MSMFGKKQKSQPLPAVLPEREPEIVHTAPVPAIEPEPAAKQQNAPSTGNNSGTEDHHMVESDLTASVSRNTVFTGNISSQDNVEIFGEVEGSVTSPAIVKIHGKVHGDVTCGVLVAGNASIVGNIVCEKSAVFGNDTNVQGNVSATVVTVSGQINGNINASESVSVSSSGAIYGDISTPEMEVSKGAIVFGSVVMEQPPAPPKAEEAPGGEEAPASAQAEQPEAVSDPAAPAADGPVSSSVEDVAPPEPAGPWTAEKKKDKKEHNPFSLEEHD